jgi:hypothetical protein
MIDAMANRTDKPQNDAVKPTPERPKPGASPAGGARQKPESTGSTPKSSPDAAIPPDELTAENDE